MCMTFCLSNLQTGVTFYWECMLLSGVPGAAEQVSNTGLSRKQLALPIISLDETSPSP